MWSSNKALLPIPGKVVSADTTSGNQTSHPYQAVMGTPPHSGIHGRRVENVDFCSHLAVIKLYTPVPLLKHCQRKPAHIEDVNKI